MIKIIDVNTLKNQSVKTNLLMYGDPLCGKTTFALTFPKPFVLSTDGNLNSLTKNEDAKAIIINDIMKNENKDVYGWVVFKEVIDKIVNKEIDCDTIIVDNIKDVYDMCRRYVLDREGIAHENESKVRGKIWTQLEEEFFPIIRKLTTSDKNVIIIAHEKKGENMTAPNTIDSVTLKLSRYMDIISRIIVTGMPGQEKRSLTLGSKIGQLGGNRYNIPGSLVDPTYEKLNQIIKETLGKGK